MTNYCSQALPAACSLNEEAKLRRRPSNGAKKKKKDNCAFRLRSCAICKMIIHCRICAVRAWSLTPRLTHASLEARSGSIHGDTVRWMLCPVVVELRARYYGSMFACQTAPFSISRSTMSVWYCCLATDNIVSPKLLVTWMFAPLLSNSRAVASSPR